MKKSTKGKILSALMGIPLVTVMATSSLLPGTTFVSTAEEPEQTATSPSDHDTETGNEDDAEIKNEGIDSTEEIVADETTTEEVASEDAVTGETASEETASEETEEVSSEEVDAKETEEASSDSYRGGA